MGRLCSARWVKGLDSGRRPSAPRGKITCWWTRRVSTMGRWCFWKSALCSICFVALCSQFQWPWRSQGSHKREREREHCLKKTRKRRLGTEATCVCWCIQILNYETQDVCAVLKIHTNTCNTIFTEFHNIITVITTSSIMYPLMFRNVKSGDAGIPLFLILSQVIHAALIDVIDQASTAKLLWCMAQLGVSPPIPRWTGNDGDTNRQLDITGYI